MLTAPTVREMFREELLQVQSWVLGYSDQAVRELFPSRHLIEPSDFFGAYFRDEQPVGTKYYDFPPTGRDYRLADAFMDDWARHARATGVTDAQCRAMVHLFLLHEFYHILQNLTSDRYQDTDHAPRGLQGIDYLADAYSILGTYRLYDRFGVWKRLSLENAKWNERLAALIQAAMRSMEVFNADPPGFPVPRMRQERFVRYTMWHLQHARARNFLTEGSDLSAFGLLDAPVVEFEMDTPFPADVVEADGPLPAKTKLFVTWRARLYRFTSDTTDFARNLRDGILRADSAQTYEALRELLQEHPDLTGRTPPAAPAVAYSRPPHSAALARAMAAGEARAKAEDLQLFTPHVMAALLVDPASGAASLFDQFQPQLGTRLAQGLEHYLSSVLPAQSSARGFRPVDWWGRDDVRKASILAVQEGAAEVEVRHYLYGVVMTESSTLGLIRKNVGVDGLNNLRRHLRTRPPGTAPVGTPGL